MAQSQEIAGLLSIRLLPYNGSERLDGAHVVACVVFDQANIQANARHSRLEPLRSLQHRQSLIPLLTPHGNYAQICIRRPSPRIGGQHLTKCSLCRVQFATLQCGLAFPESLLQIGDAAAGRPRRPGLGHRAQ